jgi:threonine dehydrogenase-like Zn-dependent dehydrogenase
VQALIWDGARLHLADAAPPAPVAGHAIVEVLLAGICSTDLQILRGYMGFRGVLGHEFVGRVIDGAAELAGRRVVGEINFSCRRCPDCLAGRGRHCPTRTVMGILGADGAFAELVRVPVENLHVVPDEIDDERAAFVEPVAAALQAAAQTERYAAGRSLVIGAGKLGLLVAQVLAARGDEVVVACRSERARSLVAGFGVTPVSAESPGIGYDLVVDATGDVQGLPRALSAVRPLGAIVLKSTVALQHQMHLAPLVINEVALIGSRCGSFAPALSALRSGEVDVRPLLQQVLPLSRGIEALESAGSPGALKILLKPGA